VPDNEALYTKKVKAKRKLVTKLRREAVNRKRGIEAVSRASVPQRRRNFERNMMAVTLSE